MAIHSEDHIIAMLNHYFDDANAFREADDTGVVLGRGDDCAIFRANSDICITTDMFIEDVHFRQRYFTPEDIGYKSLAVNISDLAATCATPIAFSMALAMPSDTDHAIIDGILSGMSELANARNMNLIGGDLSKADKICITITAFGFSSRPLLRNCAKPGDIVFLLGNLGLARTGFLRMESENRQALKSAPDSCRAHLRPKPLVDESLMIKEILREHPEARLSLMDVSDGLAQDIPRLLGIQSSGMIDRNKKAYGVNIHLPEIHTEIMKYCIANELDPEMHVISGGEDYALIGTCDQEHFNIVHAIMPEITILGVVDKEPTFRLHGKVIEKGFDHFG